MIEYRLPIQHWHNLLGVTKRDYLGITVFSTIYPFAGKESVSQVIRSLKGAKSGECRANKFH